MKKCEKCDVELIEDSLLEMSGFEDINYDINEFYFNIKAEEHGNFLGMKFDKYKHFPLKVYACPRCGMIESYIEVENIDNNLYIYLKKTRKKH